MCYKSGCNACSSDGDNEMFLYCSNMEPNELYKSGPILTDCKKIPIDITSRTIQTCPDDYILTGTDVVPKIGGSISDKYITCCKPQTSTYQLYQKMRDDKFNACCNSNYNSGSEEERVCNFVKKYLGVCKSNPQPDKPKKYKCNMNKWTCEEDTTGIGKYDSLDSCNMDCGKPNPHPEPNPKPNPEPKPEPNPQSDNDNTWYKQPAFIVGIILGVIFVIGIIIILASRK